MRTRRALRVVVGMAGPVVVAALAAPAATSALTPAGPGPRTANPAAVGRAQATGPQLVVDVSLGQHLISPDIYGVNFADPTFARAVRLPVDRWGGNTTETYNWKVRGANHGQDYYFENFADCWTDAFNYCQTGHGYNAANAQIQQDRSTHTTTLLTLPAMGWVAKAVDTDGQHLCSYPASVYDPQDDHDPYNPACGNGMRNGQPLRADPTRAGTAVGPSFSASWIRSLVSKYGDAQQGGVGIYELGNEPALWDETHRDLHPAPTTYNELWAKSRNLAAAVKGADPTAATLGPSEWGWPNYFCSAADDISRGCSASSPDRAAHGGTELSAWYLQQFAHYQQQTGKRLLDYFDLHYYPQGTYAPVTDVTRSLDDPSYTDPSWINAKIDLLPRMKAWVQANYPGTKIALSEYNLDLGVTSNLRMRNVIEADALGIFGRDGLDLATYWPEGGTPVPSAAFELFRNYDGQGNGFGDQAVKATSSSQGQLAVYAARVGQDGPLTIAVVNKSSSAMRSGVALRNADPQSVQAWLYDGGDIHRVSGVSVAAPGVIATFPADSVTMLVVHLQGAS